jgi:hypothetical protein
LHRCGDLNECTRENGGCSHICENMDGGHMCLCPKGWALGPDGRTCREEEKLVCPPMARPQYGFFKCTKKRTKVWKGKSLTLLPRRRKTDTQAKRPGSVLLNFKQWVLRYLVVHSLSQTRENYWLLSLTNRFPTS